MNKAVFFDRDGVLNKAIIREGKPYPPSTINELELVDNATQQVKKLKAAGYHTFIITNQPDVARGTQKRIIVEEINTFIARKIPIDEIFVCYHDDKDKCDCRKPLPGMILMGKKKYNLCLTNSYVIGDRWRDIEAGYNAGCKTIFIDNGYQERLTIKPNVTVKSLEEAINNILSIT